MPTAPNSTSSVLLPVPVRVQVTVRPLHAPTEHAVRRALDPWLSHQLYFFNLAYHMDDAANAIRVLYLLCEDMTLPAPWTKDFILNPAWKT